jgi:hypothetical protein
MKNRSIFEYYLNKLKVYTPKGNHRIEVWNGDDMVAWERIIERNQPKFILKIHSDLAAMCSLKNGDVYSI